jgi:ribonuclease P/MRP protein subunit POP1
MAAENANPRKRAFSNSTPPATTTRDHKRLRIQSSRTITTVALPAAMTSGTLSVSTFIKSRRQEIEALTSAMAASKAASSQRAFQSVPRDMRRRTASHNSKRVPKRLRARVDKEMADDNTPVHSYRRREKSGHRRLRAETAMKLREMGKKRDVLERLATMATGDGESASGALQKHPRGHSKFRKRQRNKTWLPTHVWHAKRAHMSIRWRFATVESPNEKCFRSTHRASEMRGAVAWDTSFMSSILLRCEDQQTLCRVVEAVCKGAASDKKVRMGKRVAECWAYERGGFPTKPIAPVTVIWSRVITGKSGHQVLARTHPSGFLRIWEELLAATKDQSITGTTNHKIVIEDLRFELGSIQITGPAATDALISVLEPCEPSGEVQKVWTDLRGLTNPAALPPGAVFGFEVSDPRLRFPPRLGDCTETPDQTERRLFMLQSTWPVPAVSIALLDRMTRCTAVKLQASQKRISKRKSDASPGEYPGPLPNDPKIPIIIMSSAISPSSTHNRSRGVWTVVLPWKWVQPVWYSLMHAPQHVRFGGIQEARNIAFDHGVPWFPADFPGTSSGNEWESEQSASRLEAWNKKPRAKRLNYEALKISHGSKGELGEWNRCDWKLLIPADNISLTTTTAANMSTTYSLLRPSPVISAESSASLPHTAIPESDKYWYLPPMLTAVYMSKRLSTNLSISAPGRVLDCAVFSVKVTLLQRGSPADTARIYRLPAGDSGWQKLLTAHPRRTKNGKEKANDGGNIEKQVVAGDEDHPQCPGQEDLVGFVTTGNYCLSEGKAICIGGIMWGRWFSEEGLIGTECGGGAGKEGERWCVVRDVGSNLGRLGKWELV